MLKVNNNLDETPSRFYKISLNPFMCIEYFSILNVYLKGSYICLLYLVKVNIYVSRI